MTVKFVHDIGYRSCKSVFASKLRDQQLLPQCREITEFINQHNITDHSTDITTTHDMIKVIVNGKYLSLDDLHDLIVKASASATRYLYLAINKFMVYTTVCTTSSQTADYDRNLVDFCYAVVKDKFSMIKCHYDSDDRGVSGNFVYPITTIFLKRHEQR